MTDEAVNVHDVYVWSKSASDFQTKGILIRYEKAVVRYVTVFFYDIYDKYTVWNDHKVKAIQYKIWQSAFTAFSCFML